MPGSLAIRFFYDYTMQDSIILSSAYLAPIQYYSKLLAYKNVYLEVYENFTKQTYRNRCKIYGANGELSISIPVKKKYTKTLMKDLLIDYDTNWQKLHWKSIESAYRSSPYFEFYEDELRPFYESKSKYLVDFNTEIQNVVLEQLDAEVEIIKTNVFNSTTKLDMIDCRNRIIPKKSIEDHRFTLEEYTQVFQEKHGFLPNLSIIDLLFNEGPNAIEILNRTFVQDC